MKEKLRNLQVALGNAAYATCNKAKDVGTAVGKAAAVFVLDSVTDVVAIGAGVGCAALGGVAGVLNGAAYGYQTTKALFAEKTLEGVFKRV